MVEEIPQGLSFEVYDQESIFLSKQRKQHFDLPTIGNTLHAPDGGNIKVSLTDFFIYASCELNPDNTSKKKLFPTTIS